MDSLEQYGSTQSTRAMKLSIKKRSTLFTKEAAHRLAFSKWWLEQKHPMSVKLGGDLAKAMNHFLWRVVADAYRMGFKKIDTLEKSYILRVGKDDYVVQLTVDYNIQELSYDFNLSCNRDGGKFYVRKRVRQEEVANYVK